MKTYGGHLYVTVTQLVPNAYGPWTLGPPQLNVGIWKYRDQIFVDHLSIGTKFDGDRLSRGVNFCGNVFPGGQQVGDWKSEDQIGSGPNASQTLFLVHKTLINLL